VANAQYLQWQRQDRDNDNVKLREKVTRRMESILLCRRPDLQIGRPWRNMASVSATSIRPTTVGELHPATPEAALVRAGGRLHAAGLIHGRSGNLSVRVDAGMWITAAGSRLGELGPQDLIGVSLSGLSPSGARPSSETAMHALIYRARPDVSAVVHTHSPCATAFAAISDSLDLTLEEADYYDMGRRSPVIGSLPAGGSALADAVAAQLRTHATVLLRDHGAVVAAASLEAAVDMATSLEHQARVALLVHAARR
jgi:ribulose-5-phosphate 4-epimerase/fuculose-1-phosphate aldolase